MTQEEFSTSDPQLKYIADCFGALSERRYSDALRLLDEGLKQHLTSSGSLDARALAKRLSWLVNYLEYRLEEDFGIGREESAMSEQLNPERLCSFCGNEQSERRELIAGPGVYICDECIKQCSDALTKE